MAGKFLLSQGVSTRKAGAALQEMAGFELSAASFSRACAQMEKDIERFKTRRLDECEWPYLLIDARYEKECIRVSGSTVTS